MVMKLRVIFVVLIALARISVGEDSAEDVAPYVSFVFASLETTSCGGSGTFVELKIDTCTQSDSCFLFTQSPHAYSITFSPGAAMESYVSTAVAISATTGRNTTVSARYQGIYLPTNSNATIGQILTFPKIGTSLDTYAVEWRIISETGRLEVCRRFNLDVLEWSRPLLGNEISASCEAISLSCNFANSVCVGDTTGTCECNIISDPVGTTRCDVRPSHRCSASADCGTFGECRSVAGVQVCGCRSNAFEFSGKCMQKTGSAVGSGCSVPQYPCIFENSVCGSNLVCGCDATTVADPSGTCKIRTDFPCTTTTRCVANASCRDRDDGTKACLCNPGYATIGGQCVMRNEGSTPGATCSTPGVSCNFENSICRNVTLTCGCDSDFVYQEGMCKRRAGTPCTLTTPCGLGATCTLDPLLGYRTCQCLSGHVETEGMCARSMGSAVGDSCSLLDIPCGFPNSICVAGGSGPSCACVPTAVEQYGVCRIRRGYSCSNSGECVAFATCNDVGDAGSICQCESGKEEVDDGRCAGCSIVFYMPLILVSVLAKFVIG